MQQENLSCQTIEAFLEKLSQCPSPEERITLSLSYMSHSLFRDKVPYFKGFWQAKEKAFENLKETSDASPLLWAQYKELCEEFHRVKIVIDEQASFAAEQIELALLSFKPYVDKILQGDEVAPYSLKHLPGHGDRTALEKAQGTFLAIHSLIEQLAALRQEVLQSTMKARLKNRLTAEINSLIEQILPLRKEQKATVTALFIAFVRQFKESYFDDKTGKLKSNRVPLIQLQREVKTLQAMAKELSITGEGFKKSRQILTPCWNTLRCAHDDYKKKQIEQKAAVEQKRKEVESRLTEFKQAVDNQQVNAANNEEKRHLLFQQFKNMGLSRDEMTFAQNEVRKILEPLYKEEEKGREATINAAKQSEATRCQKLQRLRELVRQSPSPTLLEEAMHLFGTLRLTLAEKLEIEPALMLFNDQVARLENRGLDEEKKRRQKISETLNELKKLGTTFGGADFNQALLYNQALKMHKERLLLTDMVIDSLEAVS